MFAINERTGRPIVRYQETCYYSLEAPDDASSFTWLDDDPELQMPEQGGEFYKSDEIVYVDDQGNTCDRASLVLVKNLPDSK